uniref:WW domain-containing protein n=1 Tax=Amorphochlora amoebiformis TaxID=1561963 RepID=A0A7S0CZD5_9EUKA
MLEVKYVSRCCWLCSCVCRRPENELERNKRIQYERKRRVVKRVKKALRRTGGKEAETLLRESERRERRFLSYAQMQLALGGQQVSKRERRRIAGLVEAAARQRRRRRKAWQKRRSGAPRRMLTIWWKFMKMTHDWIAVFLHRKLDPYTSQWRANVLFMSLLLVLMVNGSFYATDRETDRELNEDLWVGFCTAVVVAVMGSIVVRLAKSVGYLQWELHLTQIRARLCLPVGYEDANDAAKKTIDRPMRVESEWMLSIAAEGLSGETSNTSIKQLQWKLKVFSFLAWATFLLATIGSAFVVLVLGIKFDLEDEEGGNGTGVEMQKSASFRWLISVIVSEAFLEAIMSPMTILCQTFMLFIGAECFSTYLLDKIVDDDSVVATKAFDVYTKVVRGRKLTPQAFAKLKEIVKLARNMVLTEIGELDSATEMPFKGDIGALENDSKIDRNVSGMPVPSGLSEDKCIDADELSNSSANSDNEVPIPPLHSQFSRHIIPLDDDESDSKLAAQLPQDRKKDDDKSNGSKSKSDRLVIEEDDIDSKLNSSSKAPSLIGSRAASPPPFDGSPRGGSNQPLLQRRFDGSPSAQGQSGSLITTANNNPSTRRRGSQRNKETAGKEGGSSQLEMSIKAAVIHDGANSHGDKNSSGSSRSAITESTPLSIPKIQTQPPPPFVSDEKVREGSDNSGPVSEKIQIISEKVPEGSEKLLYASATPSPSATPRGTASPSNRRRNRSRSSFGSSGSRSDRKRRSRRIGSKGWFQAVDSSRMKPYYFNPSTGEKSWKRPPPEGDKPKVSKIGDGWFVAIDPDRLKPYYFKPETGERSWKRPKTEEEKKKEKEAAEAVARNGFHANILNSWIAGARTQEAGAGWWVAIEPSTLKPCFFNPVSGDMTWEQPEGTTYHESRIDISGLVQSKSNLGPKVGSSDDGPVV